MADTPATKQEIAAAGIALFAIVAAVAMLAWIAIAAAGQKLVGDAWPGAGLLLLMDNHALPMVGKSALFILSFGAACLARSKARDWMYYAIIILCLIGSVTALTLLVMLPDRALADEVFNRSQVLSITTYETYVAGLSGLFVPLILWLLGMLSVQLGIKQALDGIIPGIRSNTGGASAPGVPPAPKPPGQ